MRYLVRLDDITPYMDRLKFEAVRDVLDKHKIRPIIGIVPDCRDESIYASEGNRYNRDDFVSLIHELAAKGWTIAQHGTNHVYSTEESGLLGINQFSEFAGLSYDSQYTKLKQGREILRRFGIDTKLFMAPGHSFDLNTIKALKALGFNALTDGLYNNPYTREGMLFIPCCLKAYSRITGTDTICLHTNLMNDEDIAELDRFISKHKTEAMAYDYSTLYDMAEEYNMAISFAEAKTLELRRSRDAIANSPKLSNYMVYTDHPNKVIKLIKRLVCIPLLLGNKFNNAPE